jgi:hypothetical protein
MGQIKSSGTPLFLSWLKSIPIPKSAIWPYLEVVSVDIMKKKVGLRSYQVRLGPKPNERHPYKTEKRTQPWRRHLKTEVAMHSAATATECLEPPEAGRDKAGPKPRAFTRRKALAIPSSGMLSSRTTIVLSHPVHCALLWKPQEMNVITQKRVN